MELKFDPENPKYEYIESDDRATEVLELLRKEKMVGVDSETTGFDPYTETVLLVQIGTEDISYIFDARKIDLKKNKAYKALLEDSKIIKLLQNAKFDYKMIKVHHEVEIKNIYDTMLAEAVLSAGLLGSVGLKAIVQRYLDIELDKEVRSSFLGQTGEIAEEQLAYGAMDTLVLFPVFQKQSKRLNEEGLVKIVKLEFAVTSVVGDMELSGIGVDTKRWREILASLEIKRNEHAQQFQDAVRQYYPQEQMGLFGGAQDVININSQVQLMDLFNNKLKLNIPSTGVGILSNVPHPLTKLLLKYRAQEKLLSAFGESLLEKINPKTNKLHPDFLQLRTATGRFACANPNLQQIPANAEDAPFRECFNPQEGYSLVTTDYSSQEMRILAQMSGDENMIRGLKKGLDMHSYTASVMFNKKYTRDFKKEHPDLRAVGKTIGFGLVYGMGAGGLAASLDITKMQAENYMKKYFKAFPSIGKFLDKMARDAVRTGWSTTAGGRKRWYTKPDRNDPDYKRQISSIQRRAKNHPIQGTAADMIKYALVFIDRRIKKEGIDARIILTVHDEIVVEVRKDQADRWGAMQIEEMQKAGEQFITAVPILSDSLIGNVWSH